MVILLGSSYPASMVHCRLEGLWLGWCPNPSLETLLSCTGWLVQALYPPLLGVFASVMLVDSMEFPLYWIFTSLPKCSILVISPMILPLQPSSWFLLFPSSPAPVHPWNFFSIAPGTSLYSPFNPYYLFSLGLQIIAWLSFTSQRMSTYLYVYAMLVFLTLSYLTQDDFFFRVPSICLEISCYFFF